MFGLFNTAAMGFAMLGMTVFGWAADTFDPVISLIGIGSVTVVTGLMAGLLASWDRHRVTAHPSGATKPA